MQRLMSVFFLHPETEFSLTEVAQRAQIAKSAASRLLPLLAEADIVEVKQLGAVHRIKANAQHFGFIKRKIAWNISLIYESNIIEFLDEHFHHPKAIVLFGSFRLGQDSMHSDIDIAIEVTEDIPVKSVRLAEFEELERKLLRPIQIHMFNRRRIDENLFSNIANGIVLLGYLEVRK